MPHRYVVYRVTSNDMIYCSAEFPTRREAMTHLNAKPDPDNWHIEECRRSAPIWNNLPETKP